MQPKFPKPKNCVQAVVHTECRELVARGVREPYTMQNLYESPPEHTYQGWGKKFEEFCRDLKREGKEITFIKFLIFFKKENLIMVGFYSVSCISDYILPLIMEVFLKWIENDDWKLLTGVYLLLTTLILTLVRLATVIKYNYYAQLVGVWCKNTIEVSTKLILLIISLFFFHFISAFLEDFFCGVPNHFVERFDEKIDEVPFPGDELCGSRAVYRALDDRRGED